MLKNVQPNLDVGSLRATASRYYILSMVADALSKPVEEIKQLIQKCNILNVDETSARYNGGTVWLWTFHDPQTKRNYYLFDTSRGADALKKVIEENHDITLVCGGWGPSYKGAMLILYVK